MCLIQSEDVCLSVLKVVESRVQLCYVNIESAVDILIVQKNILSVIIMAEVSTGGTP